VYRRAGAEQSLQRLVHSIRDRAPGVALVGERTSGIAEPASSSRIFDQANHGGSETVPRSHDAVPAVLDIEAARTDRRADD
jgi:hypothetical protein